MESKSILVVDPDVTVGDLLASILAEEGYQVTTVQSLQAATAALASTRFDLVITEALGQQDKFDFDPAFLAEFTALTQGTPVLLCSTYASLGKLPIGEHNVVGVIAKPFDVDDLLEKVRKALETGPLQNGTRGGPEQAAA